MKKEEVCFLNSNDLAVYVHIPFCKKKCIYCDYTSTIDQSLKNEYLYSLKEEIKMISKKMKNKRVRTIYFGGGTPSLMNEVYIEEIFKTLDSNFNLSFLEEFTIEVNPESVTKEKALFYKNIGINRISMGFQSTSDKILKSVGRIHRYNEGLKAFKILSDFFDNINVDFILGLPFEDKETVNNNLEFIKIMKPSHVSYYLLDYSHDTPLKFLLETKKINLPEEDQISELLDLIYDQLDNFGYNRYEISSWSLPRKECIHNKYYWKNYEYIGFGVSAGSHIGNQRTVNTSELPTYLEKIKTGLQPQEFTNKNDDFQELIETLFMGLRLSEGLKYDYLKQRFSDELLNKVLTPLKDNLSDYLSLNGSIKLTKKGMDFSRFVFENLLDIAQTNS